MVVFLMMSMLVGMVSADECTGQDCGANMSIYVSSVTCQDVLVTYTGVQGSSADIGYDEMQENVVDTVGNFFGLSPTLGTILGATILIGGIFILVGYMMKFRGVNNNFKG